MSDRLKIAHNPPAWTDNLYLLLDGLAMDVPVTAYTLDDHPVIEPLFRGTRHSTVMQASPWLVKPEADGRLLLQTEAWAASGIVLYSDAGMGPLADHLRSLISVRMPNQQLAYCRFYHPDWASRLLQTFSEEEFQAWSGPVSGWLLQSQGLWELYSTSGTAQAFGPDDEGWFQLRAEHLASLAAGEHVRFVDRAALQLGCEPHQPDYLENLERIELLIEKARSLSFDLEQYALQYIELAFHFPEQIEGPSMEAWFADQRMSAEQRLDEAEKRLFGIDEEASA